jgi:hypothetical protein
VSFTKNFTSFIPAEEQTGNWLSGYTLAATGFHSSMNLVICVAAVNQIYSCQMLQIVI